jgi:hypothetical protein
MGKRGIKRSTVVDASGVPLGAVSALDKAATTRRSWSPPWRQRPRRWGPAEGASVHLDRGYDPPLARERLAELGLRWVIWGKGEPAPFWAMDR